LVIRDGQLTFGPFLDARGARPRTIPLDRRFAANGAQTSFTAEARSSAGSDLLPKGLTSGWAFRFPAEAARQMAALDPRESVAIDFIFPDDSVRRLYVEVGDFAAGRAFLQSANRPAD
jgi:cation transport regulator ChaC